MVSSSNGARGADGASKDEADAKELHHSSRVPGPTGPQRQRRWRRRRREQRGPAQARCRRSHHPGLRRQLRVRPRRRGLVRVLLSRSLPRQAGAGGRGQRNGTGLRADPTDRCHPRRRDVLHRAAAPAVPLHLAHRLVERSQRPDLVPRRIPPVLPAQPHRPAVGQHDLGARGQPRPRALDRVAQGAVPRRRHRHLLLGRGVHRPPQPARPQDRRRGRDRRLLPAHRDRPVPGLLQRPRPDVHRLRGQPGTQPRGRAHRHAETVLAPADGQVGRAHLRLLHQRRGQAAPLRRLLQLRQPHRLALREPGRTGRLGRRAVRLRRLLPTAAGRRSRAPHVGDDPDRRQLHRGRLRRLHVLDPRWQAGGDGRPHRVAGDPGRILRKP